MACPAGSNGLRNTGIHNDKRVQAAEQHHHAYERQSTCLMLLTWKYAPVRACTSDNDDLYRDLPRLEGEKKVSDSLMKEIAGNCMLDTRRFPQRAGEDGYISVTDSQMERIASKSS